MEEEFPYGASSVIAIIDIGVRCLLPNGKLGKRKALLVRELEVRPAHMERACVFKLDEFPPTRLKDVERVRQAVNRYSHLFGSIDGLTDMFHRFGQQAGYGQVHRLFHGGYFTSNLSVLGRLLDFGGFRSVGNWHRARSMDHIPGFGEERAMLQIAVRSIAFYFRKYLQNGVSPSASVLDNAVHNGIESAFAEECLKIWGGKFSRSSYNEIVVHVMKRFFERQQRTYVSYQLGNLPADRWVHGELRDYLLTNDRETLVTPEIRETVDIVEAHSLTPGETLVRLLCALRILMTRELLFREDLQSSIYEAIGAEDGEEPPQADVVASTIESMVARSRRDWDLGVGRLGIIAQTMAGGLAILLSFDEINMKVVMHVRSDFEANKSPESRLRFGEWSTIPVNEENLGYLKYFSNCKTALWYLDSDTLVSVSRRFNIEATNLPLVL
ncbi:MAG: hypothetical protein G3W71_20860, partial [Xanthomonas perforans]|nr:hypothetical protein [Xanthomonas perforans]